MGCTIDPVTFLCMGLKVNDFNILQPNLVNIIGNRSTHDQIIVVLIDYKLKLNEI